LLGFRINAGGNLYDHSERHLQRRNARSGCAYRTAYSQRGLRAELRERGMVGGSQSVAGYTLSSGQDVSGPALSEIEVSCI
jgi:hypothetical protein